VRGREIKVVLGTVVFELQESRPLRRAHDFQFSKELEFFKIRGRLLRKIPKGNLKVVSTAQSLCEQQQQQQQQQQMKGLTGPRSSPDGQERTKTHPF